MSGNGVLSKVYFRAPLGQPVLSILLFLDCMLVSLASLRHGMFPVFTTWNGFVYPWQWYTTVFEHGWADVPMAIHLGGNMLVLLTCGIFIERLLGTKRFALVALIAFLAFTLPFAPFGRFGIGISWVVWPFGPLVALAVYYEWKAAGKAVTRDAVFWLMAFTLFLMYVFVGFIFAVRFASSYQMGFLVGFLFGLLSHIIPTILGAIFAFKWRRLIRARMDAIRSLEATGPHERDRFDVVLWAGSAAVTLSVVLLILLSFSGAIAPP
jgi:membrane associated rhomboid family serine protease